MTKKNQWGPRKEQRGIRVLWIWDCPVVPTDGYGVEAYAKETADQWIAKHMKEKHGIEVKK